MPRQEFAPQPRHIQQKELAYLIEVPTNKLPTPKVQNTDRVLGDIDSVIESNLVFSRDVTKQKDNPEVRRPSEAAGVGAWVQYFDTSWKKEGLPRDWDNLKSERSNKRVGFIMSQQMDKLQDPTNKEELKSWTQQTKRDLEGFKLEFLSDSVVYPRKYQVDPEDSTRLVDPLYGKTQDGRFVDIEESVSEQERNGSVKESIGEIKDFLLSAPDGSLAVMTSPLGKTGFKTDDGLGIDYPDSYFFIMQKNGNEVMNSTIKTSFTLAECREAIHRLTGKQLPIDTPLETYVKTIAKIKPGENPNIQNVFDVVNVLEDVRPKNVFVDPQSSQKVGWEEVRTAIKQEEALYNFDKTTTDAIAEFEKYAQEGGHTKEDLRKGIAATILRMAKQFFKKEHKQKHEEVALEANTWTRPEDPHSFGDLLEKTSERRGCSGGGGETTAVNTLGGSRLGSSSGEQEWFTCPKCSFKADGPVGNNCPGCGLTKESYAAESGVRCD